MARIVIMASYNFNYVEVAVLVFSQGTRLSVRDALHSNGMRRIHAASNPEHMRKIIRTVEPDFALLQIDTEPEEVCQIVREIRHGRLGSNPYIAVFGVTWRAERELVQHAINAGFDDMVTLPLSIGALFNRIDNVIQRRKEFVVTTDYVGPDRRHGNRPATDDLGGFEVPNILRDKARSERPVDFDASAVTRANKTVSRHRLQRLTTRLNQLATMHEETARDKGPSAVPHDALTETCGLLARIKTSLEAEDNPHLLDLARAMKAAVQKLGSSGKPSVQIFQLLRVHAQAISAALDSTPNASEDVLSALNTALDLAERRAAAS